MVPGEEGSVSSEESLVPYCSQQGDKDRWGAASGDQFHLLTLETAISFLTTTTTSLAGTSGGGA